MKSQHSFPKVILDGELHSADDIGLSLSSRLAMYGEGCFDTLRAYEGGFLHPGAHLKRLQQGMDYLGLEIPKKLLTADAFLEMLHRYLQANNAGGLQARLRVQVWADDDTAGYRPGNRSARFLVTGFELGKPHTGSSTDVQSESSPVDRIQAGTSTSVRSDTSRPGVRLITSRYHRIPDTALPAGVKWSNGINYILAAREAMEQGADDALMLTRDGFVSETTIANIFWKSGDNVYTPSEECDLLPGITRHLLIDFLKELGISVTQGRYTPEDFLKADTAWACNSIREWYPIRQLDEHKLGHDALFWNEVTTYFEKRKNEELHHVS